MTSNFSEEEADALRAGTHPNEELKKELAIFNHVNKIIDKYNQEITFLDAKRPCPIVPETLVLKPQTPDA